jgi:hypothetical protein
MSHTRRNLVIGIGLALTAAVVLLAVLGGGGAGGGGVGY